MTKKKLDNDVKHQWMEKEIIMRLTYLCFLDNIDVKTEREKACRHFKHENHISNYIHIFSYSICIDFYMKYFENSGGKISNTAYIFYNQNFVKFAKIQLVLIDNISVSKGHLCLRLG